MKDSCTKLSQLDNQTTPLQFSDPVYLKLDFLNGARFNQLFDTLSLSSSESLGARLIKSFYCNNVLLKRATHDDALIRIVKTIQNQENSPYNTSSVPIVIHIDEFGEYIRARNEAFENKKGIAFFLDMLKNIGSAATIDEGTELGNLHAAGQYFIVPVTTVTSHSESNIGGISRYQVMEVPLLVLDLTEKELARECLRAAFRDRTNLDTWIDEVLDTDDFLIALGDTGGLPGLVYFACSKDPSNTGVSYVQHLRSRTASYMRQVWSHRYAALTCVFLARSTVTTSTVLTICFHHKDDTGNFYESRQRAQEAGIGDADVRVANYTVQDALDGGSAFLRNGSELGLAPSFVAQFNLQSEGVMNTIVLKNIARAESWTWQDFEKAHLLYLAATTAAHAKVQQRLLSEIIFDKRSLLIPKLFHSR